MTWAISSSLVLALPAVWSPRVEDRVVKGQPSCRCQSNIRREIGLVELVVMEAAGMEPATPS